MPKNWRKEKTKLAFGIQLSDRQYRLRLARYVAMGETIVEYLDEARAGIEGDARLLDIGSGGGWTLKCLELMGVADGISFYGMDVSRRRLSEIYGRERWVLTEGDVEEGIRYDAGSFDIVVCEQVLEHLHDPASAMREIGRVLCPGGLLIVGVPIFAPGLAAFRRHVVPAIRRRLGLDLRTHHQVFTARSLRNMVQATGVFNIRAIRGFRVVSGGILSPLEDFRWWWRLNVRIGRRVPWLCTEVQIAARRAAAAGDGQRVCPSQV